MVAPQSNIPHPVAVIDGIDAIIYGADGVPRRLDASTAINALSEQPHLLCHAAYLTSRIGVVSAAGDSLVTAARAQRHLDIAELFAFVLPAVMATPTADSFARAMGQMPAEDQVTTIRNVAAALLSRRVCLLSVTERRLQLAFYVIV